MRSGFTSRITIESGLELRCFEVAREDRSLVIAYLLTDTGAQVGTKPAIVLLHGSGADSVFPRVDGTLYHSLLFDALKDVRDKWNVLFVEKRGVRFGDHAAGHGFKNCTKEYLEWASYEGRVSDVCRVLDALSQRQLIADSPLLIIGSSEGSDVAAGVAAASCYPTHVALLPCSAGHGLHDSLVWFRKELERGDITVEEFQNQYDWLVDKFRDVLGGSRNSTEKSLWGHSYRRWSSHCSGAVLSDLLKVQIPIFLGIPSLDQTEGIDGVVAEFVKHGKRNLTYRNYIGYDHGFFEHTGGRPKCRHREVLRDILKWVATTSRT